VDVAISLEDICGQGVVSVEKMFNDVLVQLDKWLGTFELFGFSHIKNYWLQYINEINCRVTIKNGESSVSGLLRGIDDRGRLILEKNRQNLFISSGDMFLNTEGGMVIDYE
jgi:biotin-(acetyl-CoA carboxylase) ligase